MCKPGGDIFVLNHFSGGNAVWALPEHLVGGLAARIGFRSEFPFDEHMSHPGWTLLSRSKVNLLGLTTLVGLVTITVSSYMIVYSHTLYERLAPLLGVFERARPLRELVVEASRTTGLAPRIVIFGLGRYGERLLRQLHARGVPVLGIEFDPEIVRRLRHQRLPVRFGDGEDPGFLETLPLPGVEWVITTLPLWEANRGLLHALAEIGHHGPIAGVVRDQPHGEKLLRAGVTRIMNPYLDAADHAARRFAERVIAAFDVRTPGPATAAGALSGGNLQKYVIGREILQEPRALVVNQPTWGVDASAAAAIRQALLDLAARGAAVVVISQDLDELLELSDRFAALNEGRLSAPVPTEGLTLEQVGLMLGGAHGMEVAHVAA